MEKRRRAIRIIDQKNPDEQNVDEFKPPIKFGKQKNFFEKCTFETTLPKEWVIENYDDELRKYDIYRNSVECYRSANTEKNLLLLERAKREWERTKKKSLFVDFTKQGNVLLALAPKKETCASSSVSIQEIDEIKNSLKLAKDVDKKAELLYNWLIAKFIAGYDSVSFERLDSSKAFLIRCVEPFIRTGFASPLKNEVTDGLDFLNTKSSKKSIKELFETIMDKLEQIDEEVRQCLSIYCTSSNIESLREYYEDELKEYDKQIEITMWAVIRKGCRQLDFCEQKEELAHNVFYTVLAADAKLLERYKDNYVDILKILIQFALISAHCSKLTAVISKTHNLLVKAVEVLLEAAYFKAENGKNNRHSIVERINEIINEYYKIDKDICELEKEVLKTLIESEMGYLVKGAQIWGYSRIFDRLHRHNKRVMNIAQSAMFGLPSVESS